MHFQSVTSVFLLLGVFGFLSLNAQRPEAYQYREHPKAFGKNHRSYSIDGFVCGLNYFGDLAPTNNIGSTNIPLTRAGIGISGAYRFRSHLSVRAGFMWGRLRGDDVTADKLDEDGKFRYTRNLHFRNDIKELSADLIVDIFGHHRTFVSRTRFSPYFFIGVAFFHHNPKALVPKMDALHYDIFEAQPISPNDERYDYSPGEWVALKPLGTEGQYLPGSGVTPYSNWQFAIPAGIGIRLRINRLYDIGLEIGIRQTFTDYLDDVSGYFLDPDAFGDGPQANLSRLMADRSKEATAAVSGEARDLNYILDNVHGTISYGTLPDGYDSRPYHLINGYGKSGADNIRGKEAYDIFIVTKLTLRYYIERGFGY